MTDTERNFLGCGLAFPVGTDERGRVEFADGVTDIEQSIRIILGTAKGERVMRPEFGCGIHEYVFETIDATTLTLVLVRQGSFCATGAYRTKHGWSGEGTSAPFE